MRCDGGRGLHLWIYFYLLLLLNRAFQWRRRHEFIHQHKRSRIKFDIKKDPFLCFLYSFELFQLGCFYCLQMCLNLMPINNADVCGKNLKLQEVLFSLLFPSKDAMWCNELKKCLVSHTNQVEKVEEEEEDGNLKRVNGAKCMVVEVDEIEILFALKTWKLIPIWKKKLVWVARDRCDGAEKIINQNNGDN